ncbi:MAG: S8 family serine peptidase [Burkholderiales bacterium]|nr:S8 family serine peptidase [Burkholderiales bacterium]
MLRWTAVAAVSCAWVPAIGVPLGAADKTAADAADVLGLIVRYEELPSSPDGRSASMAAMAPAQRTARVVTWLGSAGGMAYQRTMANGADVLRFDQPKSAKEVTAMIRAVTALPGVRYVVPNRVIRPQVTPTDPLYPSQWGFQYQSGVIEGANFPDAWSVTLGAPNQTIGVVDSGIARGHDELGTQLRIQPGFPNGGYDFYSDAGSSGDGDGRDDDPQEAATLCGHGTHVAGTIAASSSFHANGGAGVVGVAGGAPASRVLMARALNSVGDDADAIDAMHWMAGNAVGSIGVNQQIPVAVNMSFGGAGACGAGYQEAIDALRAAGVLPVVAAGNSSSDMSDHAPANCRGAIAVAASTQSGDLASFSSFGAGVAITAPGVDIVSTGGTLSGSCVKSGTSMAAPHVTAAAALLRAVAPSLSVNQMALALRAGARPFPSASSCTTSVCGAGLLDAGRSVAAVTGTGAQVGWGQAAITTRENDGTVTLTVSRVGAPSQAVTAQVAAVPGSALAGLDYGTPTPTQLVWAAGDETDRSVTVPVYGRLGEQGTRAFSLVLSAVTGNTLVVAPASVPVTINEVDCNTVTAMVYGDVRSGALISSNPLDYCHGGVRGPSFNTARYSFAGQAGDRVTIDLSSTTAAPAVLDTYVYLLAADKSILAENDDIVAGRNRNSRITNFALPQTGTYFVDVTTWSATQDASGTYQLYLSQCGPYRSTGSCNVDVDGDGVFDASDALMVLRRLAGFDGDALVGDRPFGSCATRTTAPTIAAFIDAQRASLSLDIDGDGAVNSTTDAMLLLRAALGMRVGAFATGAINTAGSRGTGSLAAQHLSQQCGVIVTP